MRTSDYRRVEKAIHFLEENYVEQPPLERIADHLGLSTFHFQRLFHRWAGVSPKSFVQALTLAEAKRRLQASRSLLDASLDVGLSGPSRLHDLFVGLEAMTPGEYKARGAGLRLSIGVHDTPFGRALFAASERGLCALSFLDEAAEAADKGLAELRDRWPAAAIATGPVATRPFAERLAERARGAPGRPLSLVLRGTPFQVQVWQALLRIPSGSVVAYSDLARMAGAPGAFRAVGAAVGQNPIGWLIPCHRVIRSTGAFGDYRWGPERKRAMLGLELARG